MPKPSDKFTLEVVGDGDLTGMFFTEFRRRFPSAICFDRTGRTNQLRRNEAAIANTPEAAADQSDVETDLKSPLKTDITVRFLKIGKVENVAVFSHEKSRTFSFELTKTRSLGQLAGYVSQIVQAVVKAY